MARKGEREESSMMRLRFGVFAGGVAGALLLTFLGCGDMEGNGPGTASDDTARTSELRRRRPPPPPPPSNPECGPASASLTTEQAIRDAQTADGAAIPQASCPDHTCPEVVERLAF